MNDKKLYCTQKGVTLVEIILVIAIIAVVGATTVPVASGFLVRTYLKDKANEISISLKIAQNNSIAGKGDATWGVKIDPSNITLFSGSSYASRNVGFDQVYRIPQSITITPTEVTFNKLTGNPSSASTIVLTSNAGDTKTIVLNEVGMVEVN